MRLPRRDPHGLLVEARDRLAFEQNVSALYVDQVRKQPEAGESGEALSGSAFANKPDDLSGLNLEVQVRHEILYCTATSHAPLTTPQYLTFTHALLAAHGIQNPSQWNTDLFTAASYRAGRLATGDPGLAAAARAHPRTRSVRVDQGASTALTPPRGLR